MKHELTDVIRQAIDYKLNDIHTALPGIIDTYDKSTRSATVIPSINKVYLTGEVRKMPPIVHVPICFPSTQRFAFTFDLERGDSVWIAFSERALERWISNGHDVQPGINRKFDISDAVAFPGVYPMKASTNKAFFTEKNNKFLLGNEDTELFDILERTLQEIADITVEGKPIDNKVRFEDLKSELGQLKAD